MTEIRETKRVRTQEPEKELNLVSWNGAERYGDEAHARRLQSREKQLVISVPHKKAKWRVGGNRNRKGKRMLTSRLLIIN